MATVRQHLDAARTILLEKGIETAVLDARLLLQHVTGKTMEALLLCADVALTKKEIQDFEIVIERRARHEPVAKIMGRKEFYGRDFITTADTLDPRPDSETLVEAVLETIPNEAAAKILDVGTGTGCLVLSLLAEKKNWSGLGTDISEAALDIARRNANNLHLTERTEFIKSDGFDSLDGLFDIIVSNPPYIAECEKEDLDKDVLDYEPYTALFASEGGLYFYRLISEQAADFLSPNGWVFFEVGHTQAEEVEALMKKNGFGSVGKKKDLSDVYRVVYGCVRK